MVEQKWPWEMRENGGSYKWGELEEQTEGRNSRYALS